MASRVEEGECELMQLKLWVASWSWLSDSKYQNEKRNKIATGKQTLLISGGIAMVDVDQEVKERLKTED